MQVRWGAASVEYRLVPPRTAPRIDKGLTRSGAAARARGRRHADDRETAAGALFAVEWQYVEGGRCAPNGTLDLMTASEPMWQLAPELIEAVQSEAGEGHIEEFVDRAIRNELERARARRFLDRLDAELGPVDESLVEHFDSLFAEADAATGIG